jgi:hypothetical protein
MIQELQHLQGLLPYFFLIGAITAYIAHFKKQRNPIPWFFIGFFFGLLGLFSLFFLAKKKQPSKAIAAPSSTILIKNSLSIPWYYINQDYMQQGPISAKRLADLIEKNDLSQETLVWNEDFTDWKKIKEVPEYIQILKN